MVDGTAVVGRPDEMNCSTAICAVASCIATRSAHTHVLDSPIILFVLHQKKLAGSLLAYAAAAERSQ